jgi:hypothetical protein
MLRTPVTIATFIHVFNKDFVVYKQELDRRDRSALNQQSPSFVWLLDCVRFEFKGFKKGKYPVLLI